MNRFVGTHDSERGRYAAFYRIGLLVLALSVLQGCVLVYGREEAPRVSAELAVTKVATGRVKLLDVRSPVERRGREVAGAIQIQYGRDLWGDGVGTREDEEFLLALFRVVDRMEEVYVVCNHEVRSTQAVRLMRAHGYRNAFSISGGFMGADGHPGWHFFE